MFYQMYVKWIQIMNVQVDALGWYDVLGELYMSCIAGNARKNSNGQFFTPCHICDFMAEVCDSPGKRAIFAQTQLAEVVEIFLHGM